MSDALARFDAPVAGWPVAFRGAAAIAAGLVTRHRLAGPRFLRLFPDIYVPAEDEPADLALRSRAAYRYIEGRGDPAAEAPGVLAGYSAAELLGASCGPADAPAEVIVPGGGVRTPPGLIMHRDRLAPGETQLLGDVRVTTALRTAYDLARWATTPVEAVVAVDALAHRARFNPDLLLHFTTRYPRARNNSAVAHALAYADRRAASPMESRLRMVLVQGGLPKPELQWPVQNPQSCTAVWLDMAYPEHLIGIEYEGAEHTRPERVLRDAGRYTRLVDAGWRIYRYTTYEVYNQPDMILAEVFRARTRAR